MKIATSLPERSRSSSRRPTKVAASLAAFAIVLSGIALGSSTAQASETVPSLGVDFGGSSLTLDKGEMQYASDEAKKDFHGTVLGDETVLKYNYLTGDWFDPSWRIVEDGTPTKYRVKITRYQKKLWCELSIGDGDPLGADAVPYSCSVDDGPGPREKTVHLSPVVWSSVAGSLSAEGLESLDQGHQTSRNARFFVSGSLHKPTDPVANINRGETTSWSAEIRNGEGATAEDGAYTDFSYRILDEGQPTQYYVKGFMQNVKSLAGYKYTYECHIYSHDPENGGTITEVSPYTCDYDATESGYSDSHLAVVFTVKTH